MFAVHYYFKAILDMVYSMEHQNKEWKKLFVTFILIDANKQRMKFSEKNEMVCETLSHNNGRDLVYSPSFLFRIM